MPRPLPLPLPTWIDTTQSVMLSMSLVQVHSMHDTSTRPIAIDRIEPAKLEDKRAATELLAEQQLMPQVLPLGPPPSFGIIEQA